MAKPIKMPKLSDQMTEGKIAEWLKKEGDEVRAGDVIAQVETEKATLDVEAFEAGVLIGVAVKAGESAPVGAPIAWLGARGEKVPSAEAPAPGPAPTAGAPAPRPAPAAADAEARSADSRPSTQAAPPSEARSPGSQPGARAEPREDLPRSGARPAPARTAARTAGGRVVASPAARKRARERGLELAGVEGSGPGGRVVLSDVEGAAPPAPAPGVAGGDGAPAERAPRPPAAAPPAPPATPARRRRVLPPVAELADETLALSPMRRAIARNLAVSKPGAPHFYLEASVDARRLVALREELEELEQGPVSLNDLVVKAAAEALSRHPEVNAAWGADAIVRRGSVDVGVAVALEDGLVTPVVRGADGKGVFEIAAEIRDLAARAREKRLRPEEYQGASFTISNLGMFGVEAFYAVINPPEAAILAVGAVQKVPWVDEETGGIVAMERMRLGLSCDHRVVDGAAGARFLRTLRLVLEAPVRLVVG
jgi:pyruvate dehydrogenase E2 component (dihydrolipoamide acetyltransferase)